MPLLSYQGTCEGSVPVSSTPTAGTPAAATPVEQPGLEGRARFGLGGAHADRRRAHHDEPFEPAELTVERAQQARAHAAEQLAVDQRPAADELASDNLAEVLEQPEWSRRSS